MKKKLILALLLLSLQQSTQAEAEPIHEATASLDRIVEFVYVPDDSYRFYLTTDRVSEIRLQPGENVITMYGGTTEGLMVEDTISRNDNGRTQASIFIKPTREKISTNLVILTDRRIYRLLLLTDPSYYNPIIRWTYPLDDAIARQKAIAKLQEEITVIPSFLKLTRDNFRYAIHSEGDKQITWQPTFVYNYQGKTYIKMPDHIGMNNMPVLFIANNGKLQLANYRYRQGYFIVDRTADEIQLITGKEKVVIRPIEAPIKILTSEKSGKEKKKNGR